jgi:hypothetical protein
VVNNFLGCALFDGMEFETWDYILNLFDPFFAAIDAEIAHSNRRFVIVSGA